LNEAVGVPDASHASIGIAKRDDQEATMVPNNALLRVFEIRVGKMTGTSFTIEHHETQYLVTARHIISGIQLTNAEVEIFQGSDWKKLQVDILLPKNPNVDIAVLKIPKPLSVTYEFVPDSAGVIFGQEVYFLGFPYGLHTATLGTHIPFIKRGTLSAQDTSDPDGTIWYVDGFNNQGFSGGPIVFQEMKTKKWKVAAVVRGYLTETAKAQIGKQDKHSGEFWNSCWLRCSICIGHNRRIQRAKIMVQDKCFAVRRFFCGSMRTPRRLRRPSYMGNISRT
jgi:hypothetical protein